MALLDRSGRQSAAQRAAADRARLPNRGTTMAGPMTQAPASPVSYDSGGYSGGYDGGGGGGYASAVAPPPPPRISDEEWLAADSGYKGQLSALEQKLRDFEVENTSTQTKGTQDYDNSLLRMGWMKPAADGAEGRWNQDDRTTAFGNSYQNQMGDFASRGLLQSTLYDQANTDMLGNFTRQKGDMDTSHTNFLEELARALATKKTDTQLGRDQARVEALARRAASEGGM